MIFKRFGNAPAVHTGSKVGRLTVSDPRAVRARIELNGVDVTRGCGPERYKLTAANDIEGWIAYLAGETRMLMFARGVVKIYLNAPSDEALKALQVKGKPS